MNARRIAATFLLTAALGLAACSGDNDPSGEPPTTAPPEPADTRPSSPTEGSFPTDFAKQADQICVKAKDELDQLSPIKDEKAVSEAAGVYDDAANELEALDPPEQNADAYKEFVDAFRDGGETLGRLRAEIGRGDTSALQRVSAILDDVNAETKQLASDYGFEECAAA